MFLDQFYHIISHLVNENRNHQFIHEYLLRHLNATEPIYGLTVRSIRRFISNNNLRYRPNDEQLQQEVRNSISQLGSYYGRRMTTGALRAQGVFACEVRVRRAMIHVDPDNHRRRLTDSNRRFNPVPYNSQYFGHKIHIGIIFYLIFVSSFLYYNYYN